VVNSHVHTLNFSLNSLSQFEIILLHIFMKQASIEASVALTPAWQMFPNHLCDAKVSTPFLMTGTLGGP
jgi:hypothetical protein